MKYSFKCKFELTNSYMFELSSFPLGWYHVANMVLEKLDLSIKNVDRKISCQVFFLVDFEEDCENVSKQLFIVLKKLKVYSFSVNSVKDPTQKKICDWKYDMFPLNLNMSLFLKNVYYVQFIMLHLLPLYNNMENRGST